MRDVASAVIMIAIGAIALLFVALNAYAITHAIGSLVLYGGIIFAAAFIWNIIDDLPATRALKAQSAERRQQRQADEWQKRQYQNYMKDLFSLAESERYDARMMPAHHSFISQRRDAYRHINEMASSLIMSIIQPDLIWTDKEQMIHTAKLLIRHAERIGQLYPTEFGSGRPRTTRSIYALALAPCLDLPPAALMYLKIVIEALRPERMGYALPNRSGAPSPAKRP